MRITGSKYSFNRSSMSTIGCDVPAFIEIQTEIGEKSALHGTSESHRKQYEIRVELELRIGQLSKACVKFHRVYSPHSPVIT